MIGIYILAAQFRDIIRLKRVSCFVLNCTSGSSELAKLKKVQTSAVFQDLLLYIKKHITDYQYNRLNDIPINGG